MKFKHFLVFTVVFALVALCTSCNKPSENKIIGKWQVVSLQERDSDDPDEWEIETPDADEILIMEFRSDGKCFSYEDGELEGSGTWSYDKDNQKLTINNISFDIIKFSSKEMTIGYKQSYAEYWVEIQTNLKKVK